MLLDDFQGALAQLGARHNGIVEATGSNPVCSIYWKRPLHLNPVGQTQWSFSLLIQFFSILPYRQCLL